MTLNTFSYIYLCYKSHIQYTLTYYMLCYNINYVYMNTIAISHGKQKLFTTMKQFLFGLYGFVELNCFNVSIEEKLIGSLLYSM